MQADLSKLEEEMQSPNVWADKNKSSELGSKIKDIKEVLGLLNSWATVIDDAGVALEIEDNELLAESETALTKTQNEIEKFEIRQMLNGEYDDADAIITVIAGAGGTDAQDWASMLLRMYMRWAEQRGWKTELLDKLDGEEAGIK